MVSIMVAAIMLGSYQTDELKWRAERETSLRGERGWLSVAGLFWLNEGENSIGSEPSTSVRLPLSGPKAFGNLVRTGKQVLLRVEGQADRPLNSDATDKPDRVKVGDATFTIIERGDRIGVRLYDPHSHAQREFTGLKWYPVSQKYRISAKFVPYATPKTLRITNVLGDVSDVSGPGYVEFTLQGKPCRLEAQDEGNEFFFNFQDMTSGKETYGAGRFLYSDKPKDGHVILDFNRATNPPCAYTNFATCPRPPEGNRLSVAVKAGELTHHAH